MTVSVICYPYLFTYSQILSNQMEIIIADMIVCNIFDCFKTIFIFVTFLSVATSLRLPGLLRNVEHIGDRQLSKIYN